MSLIIYAFGVEVYFVYVLTIPALVRILRIEQHNPSNLTFYVKSINKNHHSALLFLSVNLLHFSQNEVFTL